MKTSVLAILFAASLGAGVRIESETTALPAGKPAPQAILVDTARLRVDTSGAMTILFLADGGRRRMVMLETAKNEYREMDEETMKQMGGQMQGAMAKMQETMKNLPPEQRAMMEKMMKGQMPGMTKAAAAPVIYAAKGSATVNGFACTKYEGARDGEKVSEVCAASPSQLKIGAGEMKVFDELKAFTKELTGPFAQMGGGVAQFSDPGIEGFPVEQITFRGGQPVSKYQVKAILRATFKESDFSVGEAKKVAMPAMGDAPMRKR